MYEFLSLARQLYCYKRLSSPEVNSVEASRMPEGSAFRKRTSAPKPVQIREQYEVEKVGYRSGSDFQGMARSQFLVCLLIFFRIVSAGV